MNLEGASFQSERAALSASLEMARNKGFAVLDGGGYVFSPMLRDPGVVEGMKLRLAELETLRT